MTIQSCVFITLAVVGMSFSPKARANPISEICTEISQNKNSIPTPHPGFWGTLGFLLNPGSGIGLFTDASDQLMPAQSMARASRPVLVFSPGQDHFPTAKEFAEYQRLEKDIAGFNKNYLDQMQSAATVEECVQVATKLNFTEETEKQIDEATRRFMDLRAKIFEKKAFSLIHQASRLSPQIRVVEHSDYMEILSDIQNLDQNFPGQQVDLVFIFHGAPDGTVEDLEGSIVPPSFFAQIGRSKAVHSVVLLACFPKEIIQFYQEPFDTMQANGISIFLGVSEGILKSLEPVDLSLFPYFLKRYLRISQEATD